ncbi:ATP-binding cassette domain-containing protein [Streptomyces sp. NBC_01808]|uniref:ABC transporter ATP-binding protein n=1 Tax=Streptomyces sp. NBC_01808 TaxID=2975947 RepID=UPI002DD907AC|nr:ATP-binding cassette domain-containing protein [Streptomyces sp. NBC_01808]WSA36267.1 ATP-binding cassette domain-containing protein [Streptomyces sp. NBC_01808]
MTSIGLDHVVMRYDGTQAAVDDVSLEIEEGEFFVLVGPSGCGKSTLLRLLAGLERPSSGTVRMDGSDVTELTPRLRDVAMVFQNYAIYPHMTVGGNLGYGLKVRGVPKREAAARVREVADLLGLGDLLKRRPATLSGGQLQRVAMGRAIARRPRAYLMDEPLSNLDAKLRVSMRAELEQLHRRLGVTTVYVTHDQVEAMTLGSRAAVLRAGELQQVAAPQELYARPANAFVAAFIGSPPMNFALGTARKDGLGLAGFDLRLPAEHRPPVAAGERVLVGIRPEELRDPQAAGKEACALRVTCAVRQNLGADQLLFFPVPQLPDEAAVIARATFAEDRPAGPVVGDGERLLCARVPADVSVEPGDTVDLAVRPGALHYFDPDGGARLPSA